MHRNCPVTEENSIMIVEHRFEKGVVALDTFLFAEGEAFAGEQREAVSSEDFNDLVAKNTAWSNSENTGVRSAVAVEEGEVLRLSGGHDDWV